MISGGSVSQAAAHGVNRLEELMSSLDGVVLVSTPSILPSEPTRYHQRGCHIFWGGCPQVLPL